MNSTMAGVTNRTENYRGFVIAWQEPPITSAKWTANVATDSARLLSLISGAGSKVIEGRDRDEMLANAQRYIDSLFAGARPNVPEETAKTVRDLFLEALSKKVHNVPWPEIREHLINRDHDIGHSRIEESGTDNKYQLVFQTGEKISFDGADYHFARS
jgi:hypothetical protein